MNTSITQQKIPSKSLDLLEAEDREIFVNRQLSLLETIATLENQMAIAKQQLSNLKEQADDMERFAINSILNNVMPDKPKGRKYTLDSSKYQLQVTLPPTQKVVITDESLLPKEYSREKITVTVNKEAIKADLKRNRDVPGAKLVDSEPALTLIQKNKLGRDPIREEGDCL